MKISMLPDLAQGGNQPNGISRVVESYYKYLPQFGVSIVEHGREDLRVVHAGITGADCDVAVLHGLYFTADYAASGYEYHANKAITKAVRSAKKITVPSHWVAEIIQRDMRIDPSVVPHGIDWEEWQEPTENRGYILYNKNRDGTDVCDSIHIGELAKRMANVPFLTTYSKIQLPNIKITGTVPFQEMKQMVQGASVYASLTKETFGIGVLEAMASGIPVLGFRYGGNVDTIQHGVTGYLANPNDYEDLAAGLDYCLRNRKVLGDNAREIAKQWTWEKAVYTLYNVLVSAMKVEEPTASLIIPTYNYGDRVGRAIQSGINQERKFDQIIVVDDGSTDNTTEVVNEIIKKNQQSNIAYFKKANGGVANARNFGVEKSHSKYIVCLDADDEIYPSFLGKSVNFLEMNQDVSVAYTGIMMNFEDGHDEKINWPDDFDYDAQIARHNQIPTCNVMKRSMWDRLGGQRQRYAPMGMGTEDADMWTRMGAYGMTAVKFTSEPLFRYYNTGRTNSRDYHEVDWLQWHPWIEDKRYPFASLATPDRQSHQVRQYDNPLISVIIPVGPNHENEIVNALDSLDAQSFRKWEVIVVWDSVNPIPENIEKAFPHMRLFHTETPKSGPGIARNLGVTKARSNLILFLDADDWLSPGKSLEKMYYQWTLADSIIYSNYYGVSQTTPQDLEKFQDRLVSFNPRTNEVLSLFKSAHYDCVRAQGQPQEPLYHWCLVTCLIPKKFHEQIGGFDESMKSWEDVDYHWRMAQAGICYTHIEEPLVVYQFTTGSRRNLASADTNRENGIALLNYMEVKYRGVTMSPCPGGCGGNRTAQYVEHPEIQAMKGMNQTSDNDVILVRLNDGNLGDHAVFGGATRTNYGYRASGDVFLMKRIDVDSQPGLFVQVIENGPVPEPKVQPEPPAPNPVAISEFPAIVPVAKVVESVKIEPEPVVVRPFDPQTIPGISERISADLLGHGVKSRKEIKDLGKEGLMRIDGVGEKRAEIILKALEND